MCVYLSCLAALLTLLSMVSSSHAETIDEPGHVEGPLCRFVRTAASEAQLEETVRARLQEGEVFSTLDLNPRSPLLLEKSSLSNNSSIRADRELFESSLIDWLYFEDLAPQQQVVVIRGLLSRCGSRRDEPSVPASVFGQFSASQRGTFVAVTHAMLNTSLVDREQGKQLGDAFQLIEELLDIQGENLELPSDHQFQLIVRLAPGALQKLERSADFARGENHVFHKAYPISFRQFRRIGSHGQEAGLHISLAPDRRLAEIHVDYRFGLLHLESANSDVRAPGNHRRHVDRWPKVKFAARLVRVRRAVLQ
jgi:hypothetical protein